MTTDGEIDAEWRAFVAARRREELDSILAEENLRPDETEQFVAAAFRDGAIPRSGTAVTRMLPPVSRFAPGGDHGEKKQRALEKLAAFFDRFFGLGGGAGGEE